MQETFGAAFNLQTASATARGKQFTAHLPDNPWNNGERGILCLTQQFNTMSALFNLLGACGVPNLNVPTGQVCATVGGSCGPGTEFRPERVQRRAGPRAGQQFVLVARAQQVFASSNSIRTRNGQSTGKPSTSTIRRRTRAFGRLAQWPTRGVHAAGRRAGRRQQDQNGGPALPFPICRRRRYSCTGFRAA